MTSKVLLDVAEDSDADNGTEGIHVRAEDTDSGAKEVPTRDVAADRDDDVPCPNAVAP